MMRKALLLFPLLALLSLLTACGGNGETPAAANVQTNDCCIATESAAVPDCCQAAEPEASTTAPPAPGGCCG